MIVRDLLEVKEFECINMGEDLSREIKKPFCCDLLSFAMSKTPQGAAWVTVMGNVNTLAVATLTDAACVVLAEGAVMDAQALERAKEQGITVFATELPIFDAAYIINQKIDA